MAGVPGQAPNPMPTLMATNRKFFMPKLLKVISASNRPANAVIYCQP
jgi:hypothetical protein